MGKFTFLALGELAGLIVLCVGCSTPSSSQGFQSGQPMLGSRPSPVKQFATAVGDSKFGKSVSSVFKNASTRRPLPNRKDPTSLASKVKPMTADDYVQLGHMSEESGNIESARENFHRALKMKPHHLGALLALARLFDRQGQMDRATEHYLEAVRYHPKDATAWNDLGLCYARQGRFQESLPPLEKAIELKPDRDLYRNNIATVLVELDRVDEAIENLTYIYGKAIAHYNVGYLLHRRGRQEQALQQFQLALQVDPSLEPAQNWIAKLSGQEVEPAGNPETSVARRETATNGPLLEYDEPVAPTEVVNGPSSSPSEELMIEEFPGSPPEDASGPSLDTSSYYEGWRQPGHESAASRGWSGVRAETEPGDQISGDEVNSDPPGSGAEISDGDDSASEQMHLQRLPPVSADQRLRSRY